MPEPEKPLSQRLREKYVVRPGEYFLGKDFSSKNMFSMIGGIGTGFFTYPIHEFAHWSVANLFGHSARIDIIPPSVKVHVENYASLSPIEQSAFRLSGPLTDFFIGVGLWRLSNNTHGNLKYFLRGLSTMQLLSPLMASLPNLLGESKGDFTKTAEIVKNQLVSSMPHFASEIEKIPSGLFTLSLLATVYGGTFATWRYGPRIHQLYKEGRVTKTELRELRKHIELGTFMNRVPFSHAKAKQLLEKLRIEHRGVVLQHLSHNMENKEETVL